MAQPKCFGRIPAHYGRILKNLRKLRDDERL
jgi:hypothetical protein